MVTMGAGPLAMAGLNTAAKSKNSPDKIKDAAEQFEALMMQQLLKSARADGEQGWLGTGEEDQTGQTAVDMAEQQLASVMSKNGGLGLTKVIAQGLEKKP
jgi:peptidoglycan hydrolase FlgJ